MNVMISSRFGHVVVSWTWLAGRTVSRHSIARTRSYIVLHDIFQDKLAPIVEQISLRTDSPECSLTLLFVSKLCPLLRLFLMGLSPVITGFQLFGSVTLENWFITVSFEISYLITYVLFPFLASWLTCCWLCTRSISQENLWLWSNYIIWTNNSEYMNCSDTRNMYMVMRHYLKLTFKFINLLWNIEMSLYVVRTYICR